jgi:adenosylcobinamide-GDP ribazoletransferase
MIIIKRFLLMIQFFTTIPLPINLSVSDEDFGKGLIFAPLVGLLIGGVLAGSFYILNLIFSSYIAVILSVIIYIILTGGLHMDGLGDTFDGLFSNRSKERILEIMRDSRVGTNGVLAILCIIILDIALPASFDKGNLIIIFLLMPVTGRIGSLIGAGFSKYARSGAGLGKSFIDFCGLKEVSLGVLIYLAIFIGIKGLTGLIISILPLFSAFLLTKLFSRKIGGATGDILGAVLEINQTVFLLASYIILIRI